MVSVETIIELAELAITAWRARATGGAANTAALADTLLQIVQKANAAYVAQTGKAIDPTLLKPIEPLP